MARGHTIDTSFDVRTDTPQGDDPDASSPTLRQYHQYLWDKPLPSGDRFSLATASGGYLHHRSERGEFWMTSDAVVHSYRYWTRFEMPEIIRQIPSKQLDAFDTLSFTIGAMMLFPSWTGVRHWSINQARGMITNIADRMDLTLECIRRYYAGGTSPMDKTLGWYEDFFALFGDLRGYSSFFLLDDLVTPGTSDVRFFLPFDDFTSRTATPADAVQYRSYMDASMRFVQARNTRIAAWCRQVAEDE